MAKKTTITARSWKHQSDDISVAVPVTIDLPDYIEDFSYTIQTDVAGTGNITVSGSIAGSSKVLLGSAFDISSLDIKSQLTKIDSITFTPDTIATATKYTVFLTARKRS